MVGAKVIYNMQKTVNQAANHILQFPQLEVDHCNMIASYGFIIACFAS